MSQSIQEEILAVLYLIAAFAATAAGFSKWWFILLFAISLKNFATAIHMALLEAKRFKKKMDRLKKEAA